MVVFYCKYLFYIQLVQGCVINNAVDCDDSFSCFYEEADARQFVGRNLMVDLELNIIGPPLTGNVQ